MRFDPLRERLLTAGIAPRHVRRYVRELSDHFDDLVAAERDAGVDAAEARRRARARLGDDDELFEAMTCCRAFRSLVSQMPWLVFGVSSPVLILVAMFVPALVLIGPVVLCASLLEHGVPIPPEMRFFVDVVRVAINWAVGPCAALFFVVLGLRQRMAAAWIGLGLASAALCGGFAVLMAEFTTMGHRGFTLGAGFSTDMLEYDGGARFCFTLAVGLTGYVLLRRRSAIREA